MKRSRGRAEDDELEKHDGPRATFSFGRERDCSINEIGWRREGEGGGGAVSLAQPRGRGERGCWDRQTGAKQMSKVFSNLRHTRQQQQQNWQQIKPNGFNKVPQQQKTRAAAKGAQFPLAIPPFPSIPPSPLAACLGPLCQKGAQQKCLIYQMSTPKRRQHLSSSMTMLMTTATPAAMATATATSAATASSAAWAKRRAAALVNTLPTRRDSPYPLPSLLFSLSLSLSARLSLRRHPLAAMFWKMSVDFPIRYYLLSPSPVAVWRFPSACPFLFSLSTL